MLERKENIILNKSEDFSDRMVLLYQYLIEKKNEHIISKQIYRSGTSIGANIAESKFAQSRPDFINKLSIALKEANETEYWLKRLYNGHYLTQYQYDSLFNDIDSIISILTKIVKTLKEQQKTLSS